MNKGKVQMQGTPKDVFSRVGELKELRLDVPKATLLAEILRENGIPVEKGIITEEELVNALCQ